MSEQNPVKRKITKGNANAVFWIFVFAGILFAGMLIAYPQEVPSLDLLKAMKPSRWSETTPTAPPG